MHNYPSGVTLETAPCPNGCVAADREVLVGHDRLHGIKGDFCVVECKACGLMRTNPRPTPQTIGAYYPANYGPYHAGPVPTPPRQGSLKARLRRWLGLNSRAIPVITPGRMIEIGCANGVFMSQMRDAGWAVEGIEFSEEAARRARDKGFVVHTGSVESASGPTEPVDVIAAWMVLEHLHDPVGALRKMRHWINPRGYLVAAVPDIGGSLLSRFGERRYDLHLPNHLYHFTPRSIARLLRTAGWQVEKITWQCNANSILSSLEYLARDRRWGRVERLATWLKTARAAAVARNALHLLAGWTRQSGRIEVWARPLDKVPE